MKHNRRRFIAVSGGATLAATTGCRRIPEVVLQRRTSASNQTDFAGAPESSEIDLISHHLNRLSFGPMPGDYARVRALAGSEDDAVAAYLEEQLHPDRIADEAGERSVNRLMSLGLPKGEVFEYHGHVLLRELVHGTLLRAVCSRRQLYEVMVQFWTDHFNIDPTKGDSEWLKTWDDREVIRKYALGYSGEGARSRFEAPAILKPLLRGGAENGGEPTWRFPEMVRASALSPAMLWYLDGRENRKVNPEDKPNENYARELLELHTLGVHGGYTQRDVMEVARCLTGWTVRPRRRGAWLRFQAGKVEFKKHRHDDGEKVVLGTKIPAGLGERDLDRVLDIVSLHPSTARNIATKLCRRFIADEPPKSAIDSVAAAFLSSKGDIRESLRTLFGTEEFRQTRGNKFKRPFHFVVSALRATNANLIKVPDHYEDGPLHQWLRRMGHAPFDYPTPDGYPEEANPWKGSLLWRWRFALALTAGDIGDARVNRTRLEDALEAFAGSALGRVPSEEEWEAFQESENRLALVLASPAFQMC